MPGNSCGPGRAGGRSGTTAGTAPRPEGCSRVRRRRTGAGMTGSGGRGFCASQRRAASTRATLLPPLCMSMSVMSGMSDRMSAVADPGVRRGRRWPARAERTRVSLRNAKPALPWLGTASLASTRCNDRLRPSGVMCGDHRCRIAAPESRKPAAARLPRRRLPPAPRGGGEPAALRDPRLSHCWPRPGIAPRDVDRGGGWPGHARGGECRGAGDLGSPGSRPRCYAPPRRPAH